MRHLQEKCAERLKLWGETSLEFHAISLGGETGELLNKIKKYLRWQQAMKGGENDIRAIQDEIADVIICAALVANYFGIDLETAVSQKFNETSCKHGFNVKMDLPLSK